MPGDGDGELSAVFLDRDGVINRKAPEGQYVGTWADFAFLPGALEALRRLAALPVPILVATNQRGIALGRYTEAELGSLHARMVGAVRAAGGRIDAVYHCPHDVGECDCRKPLPGLFRRAARAHGIDLTRAVVIGDRASDMEAAAAIGARRVFVGARTEPHARAELRVADLHEAARRLAPEPGDARAISSRPCPTPHR